jgi:hypothetical protein
MRGTRNFADPYALMVATGVLVERPVTHLTLNNECLVSVMHWCGFKSSPRPWVGKLVAWPDLGRCYSTVVIQINPFKEPPYLLFGH